MNVDAVAFLDLLSFVGFFLAFIASFGIPRSVMGRSTRAFLQAALFVMLFTGVSNVLEHGGITDALDPTEDYMALLFPAFFLFFVYSAMLRREVGLRLTDKRQYEAQLSRVQSRLNSFLEMMPALTFIRDGEGRFETVNRYAQTVMGSPGEGTDADMWPEEQQRELREHDRLAMEDGFWEGLETLPDREGRQRTFLTTKFRIPDDEQGTLIGGIAVDVTQRERLMQEYRRLTTILEQADESIMVTDVDGKIVYVNPAFERTTGYDEGEAIGQNPRFLQSGEHDELFYRILWDTINSGEVWRGVFVNRRKDGSMIREQASVFPVRDGSGNIVNYASVKRDITREHDLELLVLQSQKLEALGKLVGGIAHDFNNILTAVNGYAEMAHNEAEPDSRIRQHVGQVLKAGKRATELTRKLLAFGRRQLIQPKLLDVNDLIEDFQQMAERLIGEDIQLRVHLQEGISPVLADPGQVEQVLMNLIVNARDAIHEGDGQEERLIAIKTSEVELTAEYVSRHYGATPGWHLCIEVSDTGCGMTGDIKKRLFEPFFTTKKEGQGTGLGLATVYGIVKQNKGSIFVYSEPGEGTTFRIFWPVDRTLSANEETASAAPHDNRADVAIVRGEGVVLVVEDEQDVRSIAVDILSEAGYTVLQADSGETALDRLRTYGGNLDLLFTDLVMTGMDGLELGRRVKELYPHLPVLFSSGYSEEMLMRKGLRPDQSFLPKPYTASELTHSVARCIRTNRSDQS